MLVKQEGKYGVIDINGKEVVSPKYDEIKIDEYYREESRYEHAGYIVAIKTR